ncbi:MULTISPECIES: hypothetical protein [unclassified Okeania]|nr:MULTISPECIES: hypothetical protein [unclassified Okeania]
MVSGDKEHLEREQDAPTGYIIRTYARTLNRVRANAIRPYI